MSDKTMTESKKYREAPAGINDTNLEIVGCEMNQIFKGEGEKATRKNSETKAKPTQRDMVIYSNQLKEGVSIPVVDGGKPQTRSGESR